MRPERKILKDHPEVTFLWRNEILSCACNNSTINPDLSLLRNFQSGDKAQNRGFSATRWPEKDETLCSLNPKR